MVNLPEDPSSGDQAPLTLARALELLAARARPVVATESVPLMSALDRVLAEDVRASRDVPPHDNAAVDGYAFCADHLRDNPARRMPITGRAAAGHPADDIRPPGTAVRIFTGAPMPQGLDTVAMQEDCRQEGDAVVLPAGLKPGANRRRAGEDVETGSIVLHRGQRLRAQDIGIAAATGVRELAVYCRLRAAVFSTGDELREPGTALASGAIFDTNRFALAALLQGLGCEVTDLGIIADRIEVIGAALDQAVAGHQLIITSGGMSVGEEDHVKAAVAARGALHFWRLAIKPGRPIGFGEVKGVPFIGLPGNPVAMIVTFHRMARPLILALAGCHETAPRPCRVAAGFSEKKKVGRREWVRAVLLDGGSGSWHAHKVPRQGSGVLSSLVAADGLIELPEELEAVEEGMAVDFYPFSAFR